MKTFRWYEWATLAVLAGMLCGGFALSPWGRVILSSEGAPAWLQAIGALVALGVAIWIPSRQHQLEGVRAREQEAEDVRRTLTSIRDELEIRYEQFQRVIQPEIRHAQEDEILECYWLLPKNSFPVYHSVLPKLSAIDSAPLRKSIIRCYALLEGLLKTLDSNSALAQTSMAARVARRVAPCQRTEMEFQLAQRSLREYFPQVILAERHAVESIEALLATLSADSSTEIEHGSVTHPDANPGEHD